MKPFETKPIFKVMSKSGEVIETESIRCYGNATYRVFINETPVDKVYKSYEEAAEYAESCACLTATIWFGSYCKA